MSSHLSFLPDLKQKPLVEPYRAFRSCDSAVEQSENLAQSPQKFRRIIDRNRPSVERQQSRFRIPRKPRTASAEIAHVPCFSRCSAVVKKRSGMRCENGGTLMPFHRGAVHAEEEASRVRVLNAVIGRDMTGDRCAARLLVEHRKLRSVKPFAHVLILWLL